MSEDFLAFVLMPFDKAYDDVCRLGIHEAAKEVGIKAERLDDQIFDSNMLEKIYKEIEKADLIIADMSGRNANVFYEVGYADARKKLVLLLTNDAKDIPFDFLHRPHIIYNKSITNLKKELIERLKWAKAEVKNRKSTPIKTDVTISSSYVDRTEHSDTAILNFKIELHNITDAPLTGIHSIYLYSGPGWEIFYEDKKCKCTKADKKPYNLRHIVKPDFNAIPVNDWLPLDIKAKKVMAYSWREDAKKDSYTIQGTMRIDLHVDKTCFSTEVKISTEVSWEDIPF
jgi:nucleoside 2-deoxyribosyltransferase